MSLDRSLRGNGNGLQEKSIATFQQSIIGRNETVREYAQARKFQTSGNGEGRKLIATVPITQKVKVEYVQDLYDMVAQAHRLRVEQERWN